MMYKAIARLCREPHAVSLHSGEIENNQLRITNYELRIILNLFLASKQFNSHERDKFAQNSDIFIQSRIEQLSSL